MNSGGGIWGGPVGGGTGNSGTSRSTFYLTALDYKKGYDWRSDQAVGSVKCSLTVYADGVPVMKVPVGDEYEVSSDPDMHRIIDGHLYTDYSTDAETVIKKDGKHLFRYPGRESIYGMSVIGEDVFTLGESRDGWGFCFRKNGEVVLERENAVVTGTFFNDDDTLCFAFCEKIRNAEGFSDRYYAVVDGKVSQVALRDDIRKVWDVFVRKDKVVYLASLTGVLFPVVMDGNDMVSLVHPLNVRALSYRLLDIGGEIGVEGLIRYADGRHMNAIWVDGKMVSTFVQDRSVSVLMVRDGRIFCATNPSGQEKKGTIYRDGEAYDMPEGYVVMGNDCMDMVDGILHVGLSSMEGKSPLIWKDSRTDTLKINGYISTVSSMSTD